MLELLLQDSFTVLSYDSPEAAMSGLLGKSPDLLVIDIGMPNMDGAQLLAFLKSNLPATPAVAFTGFTQSHELTLADGFDLVIHKPEVDSLVDAVYRLTAKSKKKAS